jgi:hypothetical protein
MNAPRANNGISLSLNAMSRMNRTKSQGVHSVESKKEEDPTRYAAMNGRTHESDTYQREAA